MELATVNWSATIITGIISGVIVNFLGWGIRNAWAKRSARARRKRIAELEQESARIAAYASDPGALYLYSLQIIMSVGTMLALAVGISEVLSLVRSFSLAALFTSVLSFAAFLFGWEGLRTLRRVRDFADFRERTDEQLTRLKRADT